MTITGPPAVVTVTPAPVVETKARRVSAIGAPSGDCSKKPGLADPGFAGQQEELAATLGRVGDPSIGQVEQVVAPDEQRAEERRNAAHPASVPTLVHGASVE